MGFKVKRVWDVYGFRVSGFTFHQNVEADRGLSRLEGGFCGWGSMSVW